MANCAATRADGSPCKGVVAPGAAYCWAHDPAHASERQANARKGGQTGGQGRPSPAAAELTEIRGLLRGMLSKVYKGEMEAGTCYAMNAICNTRLRVIEVERKLKEAEEFEQRLAALEQAAPPQGRSPTWRA